MPPIDKKKAKKIFELETKERDLLIVIDWCNGYTLPQLKIKYGQSLYRIFQILLKQSGLRS